MWCLIWRNLFPYPIVCPSFEGIRVFGFPHLNRQHIKQLCSMTWFYSCLLPFPFSFFIFISHIPIPISIPLFPIAISTLIFIPFYLFLGWDSNPVEWFSHPKTWFYSCLYSQQGRISEIMSCEESVIFFASFAYIAHIRQNHSTFPPIETKYNLKNVILIEVPGVRLI